MSSSPVPSIPKQLAQLIASPSVSSTSPQWDQSNLGVVQLLAQWLESIDFDCEILAVEGAPGKFNLIATRGSGPGGLVLSGHTDTVPFDDELWQQDPLQLCEKDNRWYGLGTSDMKGFFPLAIEAASAFQDTELKQPLIILATADEESSMSGARALTEIGRPLARYAIIGEPTGLKPVRLHKGMMMEAVRIQGKSGHSSNPDLGNNALDAMHDALSTIITFKKQLQHDYSHPGFAVSFPTLNLGCIHGGDNPNRICGHCELQFDLRPLPGMQLDSLREDIARLLLPVAKTHQVELSLEPLFEGIPAHETDADSPIVKVAEKLTGHSAISVNFATEAPFLAKLGMQTLVLGPGDIDQAHQPDEFLALERIDPMVDQLKRFIREFCL